MTRDEEILLEQVVSAHRERALDGAIRTHPAWHDLPEDVREQAFAETVVQRQLEAALNPNGLSTTARSVLARIRGV